jgi:very-short-patch-repair endonuclease
MKHMQPMFYGAKPELFRFAEKMRYAPTDGELAMWRLLKSELLLTAHKFRRQHPISTFIADFYSHKLRLVVEIDGGYHQHKFQKEYDDFRDGDMNQMGITVIRFTNEQVIKQNELVLQKLLDEIRILESKSAAVNFI